MNPDTDQKKKTQAQSNGEWASKLEAATREVFEMMLGTQLKTLTQNGDSPHAVDLTAMVGLAGEVCGVLSVRCPSVSAAQIATKMLGTETSEGDESVRDAVGEVCNMVAGNFKNKIEGLSEGCMLSVPTIISGGDYNLYSMADGECVEVAFDFDGNPVTISLELRT
jgi:chemotaxis protein CheX